MKNKQLLDKLMKDKKVFLSLRMNGDFLGIAIKKIRPKSKEEWLKYVVEWKMKNPSFHTTFNKLNNFCKGRIKDKEIVAYLDQIIIDDAWKGFENEMIVEKWLVEKLNASVEPSSPSDDKKGVDMWIKQGINQPRIAISVKSAGFNRHDNGKGLAYIKRQAKALGQSISVIRVNDDKTIKWWVVKP